MEWSDTGLVLGIGTFREADVWLRLLTRQHGLVHVFAFGGSRSRRRFPGCLDLLNRLSVHVDTDRAGRFFNLREAVLTAGVRRLRTDGRRLGIAVNCMRFVEAIELSPDSAATLFDLSVQLLDLLEGEQDVQELLALWFRLRVASDQGFAPDFQRCSQCGSTLIFDLDGAFWHVSGGSIYCAACASGHRRLPVARLAPGMVAALAAIQQDPPCMWRVDGLPAGERQELVRLTDEFVEYHLGLRWERGRFVKA